METQRIAEHLAGELECSVVLTDRHGGVRGVSYVARDSGAVWACPLATAPPTAPRELGGRAVHRAARVTDKATRPGLRRWLTVPLSVAGERVGWGLFGRQSRPLGARELSLVDVSSELFALTNSGMADDATSQRSNFAAMLDADPEVRRGALRKSLDRRWMTPGESALVHALVFDECVGFLERLRVTRVLCRSIPGRLDILRGREDAVFVLSRCPAPTSGSDELLRVSAAERGFALAAVGSARVRVEDEDLARPARAALIAAELSVTVPELAGTTDADELGGWALLHAIRGDRSLLGVASPAAEALCGVSAVHRTTVETYLDSAGHVLKTCERLHIHRTTLYYRLDNLPEVVKVALGDGMQRSTLHLALKLDRLWAAARAA